MQTLPAIKNISDEQLDNWLVKHGFKKFRRRQINNWLYNNFCCNFERMRNVPDDLIRELGKNFRACAVQTLEKQEADDGTWKYLFELGDGETIETVLIPDDDRNTVCISSQVGCPVGCYFCASGKFGLTRNLDPAEIVDQVLYICGELGQKVDNIVVMGIGEPLLNTDNLIPALKLLNSSAGLELGARRVTVSTSGIVPGIRKLAEQGVQWNLALSLHGTNDEERAQFIPQHNRYPLSEILEACRYYNDQTGRMITFEYTLIEGYNSSLRDADRLIDCAYKAGAKVNLIPCNPVKGGCSWKPPSSDNIAEFRKRLENRGLSVTQRKRKGDKINAACGQLRSGKK